MIYTFDTTKVIPMANRARESVVAYHAAPVPVADTTPTARIRAKLFANGRSQAVRLPKEFRLPGTEVLIRRDGERVILEPVKDVPRDAKGWPVDLWKWLDQFHDDFPDPEPMAAGLLEPEAIPPFDAPVSPPHTAARRTRQRSTP